MINDAFSDNYLSIINELLVSKDVDFVWARVTRYMQTLGLDKVTYACLDTYKADLSSAPVIFRSTLDISFFTRYARERFDRIDPIVIKRKDHVMGPIDVGIDLLSEEDYEFPEQRVLMKRLADCGMCAGTNFLLPAQMSGTDSRYYGITLGSSLPGAAFRQVMQEYGDEALLMAHQMHQKFHSVLLKRPVEFSLSPKEIDSLTRVALGIKTPNIAAEMGIEVVTLNLHLKNARNKLGAINTTHAVAIAMQHGLINL